VLDRHAALEGVLGTLRRVQEAWRIVLQGARAVENPERVALAKAKLVEVQREIARIQNLLRA
jgi:hypothetical protein